MNTDNVQNAVVSSATVVSSTTYVDVTSVSYTKQNASSILKITACGSLDQGPGGFLRVTDGSGTVLAGPHLVVINATAPSFLTASFTEIASGIPKGAITIKLQCRSVGGGNVTLAPLTAGEQTKFSLIVEEH